MSKYILDLVKKLNGGNVLNNQPDEETYVNLYKENIWLYRDMAEDKNYFFATFNTETNSLQQIETNILNNDVLKHEKIKPSDSYLILFWEIEKETEFIYPTVINIEENEFFFKKYIFYYTTQEYEGFLDWIKDISTDGNFLTNLINKLSEPNESLENSYAQFLIKLLVKVPILNPVFPKAELVNFNEMVKNKLSRISTDYRRKVIALDSQMSEAIDTYGDNSEIIAEEVYKMFMGEENK